VETGRAADGARTKEPQYQGHVEFVDQYGRAELGAVSGYAWHVDPRRLGFVLARYKFAAKMLEGMSSVLEVGCADGFGSRVVRQHVERLTASDFDPIFIEEAIRCSDPEWEIEFRVHDILDAPVQGPFDGAFALDVVEHIPPEDEDRFVDNIAASLVEDGVAILGSPSLESQEYASELSRQGHVNCKSHRELRALLERRFRRVFTFSMSDEVVHTGFGPMAHYLLVMGVGVRADPG
jgi:2-polyprenyl-3-methyl-5-hydroxy-6-metoxy-1,4-benzoquinol methylase